MSSPRPLFYSLYILKTVKKQFYCVIMRRYFSRIHKEKGVVGGLSDLILFLETVYISYFLLAFYFRILILYTTVFKPKINKDVIIIRLNFIAATMVCDSF